MLVKLYWILICLKPVFFKTILIKFMKVCFFNLSKIILESYLFKTKRYIISAEIKLCDYLAKWM